MAAQALASLGVSLDAVRSHVEDLVGPCSDVVSGHIPFTPRAKKLPELSLALKHSYIGTEHILLGPGPGG